MSRAQNLQGVDPILTQKFRLRKDSGFVAERFLPVIPVPTKVVQLPNAPEDQFEVFNTERPHTGDPNILRPGLATRITKELKEHDVSYPVDYLEDQISFMNLRAFGSNVSQKITKRRLEYETAALLQTYGNYGSSNRIALTGTNCWDNASSHPLAQIEVAKEAILAGCGELPNALLLDYASFSALRNHADVTGKKVYTDKGIIIGEDIAAITGIKNIFVATAFYKAAGVFYPMWTDSPILAYVPELPNDAEPSMLNFDAYFASILRMTSAMKVDQWASPDGKTAYMRATDVRLPVIHQTSITGAYIFANTIT